MREASKRTLGLRHYDVQLIGGMVLHYGRIAEMRTGEGKTLVATLPLYLNALTGRGVHLVTVNDYLARRDARWMAPIYQALGMSVGVLQMAARTDNGRSAFLVDLKKTSPHEDQHQLQMVSRAEAYKADITYGTNSEFGFDYLRDNLAMRLEDRVQRGHYYAIVDEVDNILIDEARTPLIISGPAQDESEWYVRMAAVVKQLNPEDYEIDEKNRTVTLTEVGEAHVEALLDSPCATLSALKTLIPNKPACWDTWNKPCGRSSFTNATRIIWCRAARSSSLTSLPGASCPADAGRKGCIRQWKPKRVSRLNPKMSPTRPLPFRITSACIRNWRE